MTVITRATRVAFVGGGKMGEALLSGWIHAKDGQAALFSQENFAVSDPNEERRVFLKDRYGVACAARMEDLLPVDIIVLAVKPQVMMSVLKGITAALASCDSIKTPLFVSIAAGLSTATLEKVLPEKTRLVRVMPNTPLLVGAGESAVTGGSSACDDDVELVRDLFACLGDARIVEEKDMDAVCGVSGSGPAYVAAMIEALADAGVQQGLDEATAEALALQTVYGTAELIRQTGHSPAEIREAVCSPGGTTLAALTAMNEAGFAQIFQIGVAAAVRRSKELGACL